MEGVIMILADICRVATVMFRFTFVTDRKLH